MVALLKKSAAVRSVLNERQIRLMTNSRKSQSEKLAPGGGRETTAVKPDNKLGKLF